jgi:proteasome accessory factor B
VSRKTERLVNLTIALLATKRYITKSEIFRTVDGYEGSAESKERMFERDKDDLRNLGIEIEVGSFDPLFEDEAGYRIKPDRYQFQLGDINSQEISLLSLAAEAWRGAALDGTALTALRKLHAMGIESDIESIPDLAPHANIQDKNLQIAISAITSKQKISFAYLGEDLSAQERKIAPYAVTSRYGHWYLYGFDLEKEAVRSFRLDRLASDIKVEGKTGAFEVSSDFNLAALSSTSEEAKTALLYLRTDRALALRSRSKPATKASEIAGWDLVEIKYRDQERFIEEVLWYGEDAVLIEPHSVQAEIIARLESGVKRYA